MGKRVAFLVLLVVFASAELWRCSAAYEADKNELKSAMRGADDVRHTHEKGKCNHHHHDKREADKAMKYGEETDDDDDDAKADQHKRKGGKAMKARGEMDDDDAKARRHKKNAEKAVKAGGAKEDDDAKAKRHKRKAERAMKAGGGEMDEDGGKGKGHNLHHHHHHHDLHVKVPSKPHGKGKIEKDYDNAKAEVADKLESARRTMSNAAKDNYEAAKEKASQAVGELGAKLRSTGSPGVEL